MTGASMATWLHWARGPLFWAALAAMVLGLARHFAITLWDIRRAYRRAGDKRLPTAQVARATLRWLVPVSTWRHKWPYSVTTMVLHVAVIVVPLFLATHIELVQGAVGLSWPALPDSLATGLTLAGIAAALVAVLLRVASRDTRPLSRFQDLALPPLIALVFGSGFMAMHPLWNPFAHDPVLLVHVLSGDLLLLLVPLTKLSHMLLLPLTQIVSELAWHLVPDAGQRVGATLGKEQESI